MNRSRSDGQETHNRVLDAAGATVGGGGVPSFRPAQAAGAGGRPLAGPRGDDGPGRGRGGVLPGTGQGMGQQLVTAFAVATRKANLIHQY